MSTFLGCGYTLHLSATPRHDHTLGHVYVREREKERERERERESEREKEREREREKAREKAREREREVYSYGVGTTPRVGFGVEGLGVWQPV